MNNDLREKAKKYGIYAVLAAALLIFAAVSAVIDKKDSKRVIIYSTSETENIIAENDSSKAKSEKSKKSHHEKDFQSDGSKNRKADYFQDFKNDQGQHFKNKKRNH
ncbi:hypothetical protein [Ruminococcus albus]|uniref:Competence protein ComEA n=1 Tax=Ruminococcus albus TaxID=1264 RepID=A0A1I1MMR9_RUMAL|nr:hypothetical protein [Ruminococcus albus]SFC86709.1 competence protein ComEA [Ruminococcus albus]